MRPYLMEVFGTFFLTMAVSFTGNPIAIGLMLASMIYIGAHVSGAHYNPALSLAAWMRGALKPDVMLMYMGAQVVGAAAALWLFKAYSGTAFLPEGSPAPFGISVLMEVLLTGVLALSFLTLATGRKYKDHPLHGFGIGFTLMAIAFIGGMFNPAIAFATMLFSLPTVGGAANAVTGMATTANTFFLYIGAPLLGGAFAAWAFKYFYPKD